MSHSRLREIAALADPMERARALGAVMTDQQALVEEAARMRRQAIAEARESGHRLEDIANVLGVSPGRVSQMRKGSAARAPEPLEPLAERTPPVIVQRSLPTEPTMYGAGCMYKSVAERQGVHAELRILGVDLEPAREHVATCLRVRPGEDVIARRRLMLADDVPVRIAVSYFRADLFAHTAIMEPKLLKPTLHEAIVACGHAFGHAEETLVARPADPPETGLLRLDPDDWVVQVLRASYSTDDTPIHVLETVCAATRHVFTVNQAGGCDQF
ncbi:UTRA domain-containing protein [Actinoallomurus purpureus]|uniref:UTRA domain-containing protein n=1 Tax=Actinoallomurus purpureus TaxID=478114 RepID=UPI0020921AFD|nr:UTRA domain-containing protein [Actinoallomurus purpureus]MCO6010311.1 UTRA domain-containing protein [Actinoallomurus purpureus]